MPLLKFNLRWDDDINVERDIEILHTQTFADFHLIIKKHFVFPPTMEAVIYVCDDGWKKGQAVSSVVERNIRGAKELSMQRTPIGALLGEQNQKFVYTATHKKNWALTIELISMKPDPIEISTYPKCIREEGVSPATFGKKDDIGKDAVVEIEEKYDLGGVDSDDDIADLNTDNESVPES